jgi:hypothetical protein
MDQDIDLGAAFPYLEPVKRILGRSASICSLRGVPSAHFHWSAPDLTMKKNMQILD